MIQNYIFDLYGTLVDIHTDETKPCLWKRMALFMTLQGAPYDPKELQEAYGVAVARGIEQRARQLPTIQKAHIEPDILQVFAALYAQKGVPIGADALSTVAQLFRTLAMCHIRLYPRARKVLRTLRERGRGVYLLSNAQAAYTVPELNMLGLTSLFDGIVLSSDVGVKKPDKTIFQHMLSKYGLSPETCWMIGNDGEADMLGAASIGMAGRYIHTKQSPSRQGPLPDGCIEIKSLVDLIDM